MTRRAAAIVLVFTLTPAMLSAQDIVFTVTAPSAEVHKGPSTVTPIIGHVSRGTVLHVARDLGSWAKVSWPTAPDRVGYVHVTMGRLTTGSTDAPAANTAARAASTPTARSASPSAVGTEPAPVSAPRTRTSPDERVAISGPQGVTTISHVIGVGALLDSMRSIGATGRAWHRDRFGLEFRLFRNTTTSEVAAGRVTSLEFEPRVVYAVLDHVSDYVWVRPYVGSGVSFNHQTFRQSSPADIQTATDNTMRWRVFGGSELTFATVTRFGLSAEVGYRSPSTPFPGFETDRVSLSIAGHWYVK